MPKNTDIKINSINFGFHTGPHRCGQGKGDMITIWFQLSFFFKRNFLQNPNSWLSDMVFDWVSTSNVKTNFFSNSKQFLWFLVIIDVLVQVSCDKILKVKKFREKNILLFGVKMLKEFCLFFAILFLESNLNLHLHCQLLNRNQNKEIGQNYALIEEKITKIMEKVFKSFTKLTFQKKIWFYKKTKFVSSHVIHQIILQGLLMLITMSKKRQK